MLQTALHFSHILLESVVHCGNTVVDATMGNGNDTAFLADLVGPTGQVYAFDVQEQAIQNTKQKLSELGLLKQATLLRQGHETVKDVLSQETILTAAIFNLGYLPKSGKEIITQPTTTKQALDGLLPILAPKGRIILVVYYGHDGGELELDFVQSYCQKLPQKQFNVLCYQFINQENNPPILYCIEKK